MFDFDIIPDKYLYHYTSYTTALEYLLPSGTLRFNPYSNTNDPRESKDWLFSLSCPDELPEPGELNLINDKMNTILKRNTKVICFTKDVVDPSNPYIDRLVGRGFSHPRMWAQYSGNHKGVCLMFDKNKLEKIISDTFSNNNSLYQGSVSYGSYSRNHHNAFHALNYSEIKHMGIKDFVERHLTTYNKELFFEKLTDWKDECEYRWVLFSKESNQFEYVKFADSLVAIVLGIDFPPVYESILEIYSKKFNVHVVRMNWYNGVPTIHPVCSPEESHIQKVFDN